MGKLKREKEELSLNNRTDRRKRLEDRNMRTRKKEMECVERKKKLKITNWVIFRERRRKERNILMIAKERI